MTREKWKVIERKLGRERAFGQAHSDGLIELDPRQSSKEYLDTAIHEGLHLLAPDWTERQVAVGARKLSSLLWALGFRRVRK